MLEIQIHWDKIYSHIRKKFIVNTPEELVRQRCIRRLVNTYGYSLDQIQEEVSLTNSGRWLWRARADIVVWRNKDDMENWKKALIVFECKSPKIPLSKEHFFQGLNYARWAWAPFFVVTNGNESTIFKTENDDLRAIPDVLPRVPKISEAKSKAAIASLLLRSEKFKEPTKEVRHVFRIGRRKQGFLWISPSALRILNNLFTLDSTRNSSALRSAYILLDHVYWAEKQGVITVKIADVFSKFFQRKSFSSNVFSSSIIDDLKLIMAAQGMQGVCQDTTGIIESIDEKNMTVTVRKNSEGCRYYIPHLILFPRDNKLRGFYRVLHILFNELIVKKNVEVPREILADAAWVSLDYESWKRTIERGIDLFLARMELGYSYRYSRKSKMFVFKRT